MEQDLVSRDERTLCQHATPVANVDIYLSEIGKKVKVLFVNKVMG